MYYELFLPYLKQGFMVKNLKEIVNIDEVYCPIVHENENNDIDPNTDKDVVVKKVVPDVIHVLPLNIKVFDMGNNLSYYVKKKFAGKSIECNVTYIDYTDIAKRIELEDNKAYININGAFDVEEGIVTDKFINLASNGLSVNLKELEGLVEIKIKDKINILNLFERVNEDAFDDLGGIVGSSKKRVKVKDKRDASYEWLDAYFRAESGKEEMVPLLIGPTAVFKSATIKELCKKYDYRLVDFRVAFTSRLDYSGLYEKEIIDGQLFSYPCPMEELVTCSDGFREYCKRAVNLLEEYLEKGTQKVVKASDGEKKEVEEPLTDEQKESIKKMIEKYKYYTKTPVLFFDEITRNSNAGVNGVLVQLLNKKEYGGMKLKGCKFVAATNLNLDNDLLNEIYHVEYDIDKAYLNRFIPIKIRPEDVKVRWFEWAEEVKEERDDEGNVISSKTNIHPDLLSYLKDNPSEVYNDSIVEEVFMQTGEDRDAAAQPFPNYRTWHLVSDYLYKEEGKGKKEYNYKIIAGLVSEPAADKLVSYLQNLGWSAKQVEEKDEMTRFIEDCLDSKTPAMLIGPSSIGKTARVKNYVEEREDEIIEINLASMDRTDIMGMPAKQPLHYYVVKDALDKSLKGLSKELKKIIEEVRDEGYGLTDMLTVRAPQSEIARKFIKAYEEGKNIVLFFDECNRVTNKAVMSAMFEAISDNRLFGINFDPSRVKIIAACNMGDNYKNAGSLDPAISARFAVYDRREYRLSDVESYIELIEREVKKGNFDPIMLDFFKNLEPEKALEWMKRVEEREIENAEPTTRAFSMLAKDIRNMKNSRAFSGVVIFNTDEKIQKYSRLFYSDDMNEKIEILKELCELVFRNEKRWVPIKNNEYIEINDNQVSASKLIEALRKGYERVIVNPLQSSDLEKDVEIMIGILESIYALDDYIKELRQQQFEFYIGAEAASDFASYFNVVFGYEMSDITIPMLSDDSLIPDFFEQKLGALSISGEEKVNMILDYCKEFHKEFANDGKVTYQHYDKFIMSAIGYLNTENVQLLFIRMKGILDDFMVKVEEGGNNVIKTLLNRAGYNVSDGEIEKLRKRLSGKVKLKTKLI